jgi:hypothetical protein
VRLDIRVPIGLLFCAIGLILVVYGAVSGPVQYERSLGININLWWGSVLLLFGALMLLLSRKSLASLLRLPRGKP